jgi:hypothetical protein
MPRRPEIPPDPADAALMRAAVEAAGMSQEGFAVHVLGVDARTGRGYVAGERPLTGPVRQLARAVVRDPALAAYLAGQADRADGA